MDRGQSQRKRKRAEEESTKGASTSSFISPEATVEGSGQYDVFLSFSGLDTRKTFTDYLYQSLINRGIRVFRDDNSIQIGEDIGSEILDAIAQSKISIPVISENYASSKWCLLELIHIMDRKESTSHKVLPIFYKVAPSDVRHLEGNFGNAFRSSLGQLDEKNIQKAQQALYEVCGLKGWESEKSTNGYEGELVARVVKTVMSELWADLQLDVPEQLVGLDGHMKNIMNWIDSTPSINARMIGIYGMGGIGKTTLAKCIYNELSNKFVHRSFLPDVRETTKRHGITSLQSQLISDILHEKKEVSSIDLGINIIKSRFRGTKVLILLDDIDDKDQLDKLARKHNWFMAGSMIIVTTRNKAVLDQSEFEVCYEYELNGLDEEHSLFLFNRHAFRKDRSPQHFKSISHDIISTMGGLPLALQVVGSYLYKKMNRKVWEDVREQLKNQLHKDVQKILQISYNALEDGHKQIFLDIVCYFIGEDSKYAMYMWEADGLYPSQGIEELKLRCLIKIRDSGVFEMHDQLRDLGRSIFYQGQQLDKCSGPWDCNYRGASRVLYHEMRSPFSVRDWMLAATSGDSSNELLSEVRWLEWEFDGSDWDLSPTNLHLPNLSVLELFGSNITEDWEGWSSIITAKRLRVLDLRYCGCLRCTPDLSAFTQLEILILSDCYELEHLHPSVGKLTRLVSLDLSFCGSLNEIPEEVGELKDLEGLNLGVTPLTEIPSSIWDLQNLQDLDITFSPIEQLPSAIGRLKNLRTLRVEDCYNLEGAIPTEIGDLSSLEHLNFDGSPITDLPESIRNLSSLQSLCLWHCDELRSLPEQLPSSLKLLRVTCQSPRLPQLSSLIHLQELGLWRCHQLEYIPKLSSRLLNLYVWECGKLILLKLDEFKYLETLWITECSSIERLDLSPLIHLKQLRVEDCNNLVEIQGERLQSLVVKDCKKLTQLRGFEKSDLIDWKISGCDSLEALPKLSGKHFVRNYERKLS